MAKSRAHLAIVSSHPIQYYAPMFRALSNRIDLHVFYAHNPTAEQQGAAGYGVSFEWDVDLLSGYPNSFLSNHCKAPRTDRFAGCDTPEVGAQLCEGRFDALLLTGWNLKSYWQAIWTARRAGMPVMARGDSQLATRRSRLKHAAKSLLYPRLLRLFDAGLYVGKRNRDYWRHFGFPDSRLFHSPHCVDTRFFGARSHAAARARFRAEIGIAERTKVVLFAGRLLDWKRPLDTIEAVARIHRTGRDVVAMIAGAGPLAEACTAAATSSQTPLIFLSFKNQSQMPAVFAAADCLVLPSEAQETWGLVANEALACGTPVIVSDACGCAADLADSGTAARSFPAGDVDRLANVLEAALASPSEEGEARALAARFSPDRAAEGIVTALDVLLSKNDGRTLPIRSTPTATRSSVSYGCPGP